MEETRQLARFVAETGFEDIPLDVLERAKVFALDNLAGGLVGSVQAWSKMVAEMVQETRCKEECTVFGQAWRTSPSGAALVNGTMIGAFETDHGYAPGAAHPGAAVFPAIMAMAERDHKDGKSFLTAMVLGYEAICRIGEAATRAVEDERGYHGPATNAPFGAAIAVGKLLGFDEVTLANAIGIAGSHSAGLLEFIWDGAMTKRFHLGRGSQMGLESAILASKGFTGPNTILEGRYGFFKVFSPVAKPERLLADLGKTWVMKDQIMKLFACHGTQMAIVQGLVDFMSGHQIEHKDIRRVVVTGSHTIVDKHQDREPTTIMGAQYSLPFVVAIALTKDISNPLVFNEETLRDMKVRELVKRVELVVDPRRSGHWDPAAEVTIELGNQRHTIQVKDFKGSPTQPFSFDDMCDKFRRYSVQIIGKKRADDIIDKVANIDTLTDLAELAYLMRA